MKSVSYEKPSMKFVDLRSEQQIAAADGNCMPMSSQHQVNKFYWDAPGDGWVEILATGDCSGNCTINYIDNSEIPGEVDEADKQAAINQVRELLSKGNTKQAFSGAVWNEPDPSWS